MLENNTHNTPISNVNFTVDAGIINRLGKELVGRAETAVSELVKNAYDADANVVELTFINTETIGGELQIFDDGHGMTLEQLINGFMRLSSSDKLHNPVSPKFHRVRAGRKGIGRFATQRLGDKLTIITKVEGVKTGLKLVIDWSQYNVDQDLEAIKNPIESTFVDFDKGTKLIISGLREAWWETNIKRVFRYVSDLLQPSFLSDRSSALKIGNIDSESTFNTKFYSVQDGEVNVIADVDSMVFDHALGVIEGFVENGQGICEVISRRFSINDTIELQGDYSHLENIHFKAYYFIYNFEWYEGLIPKMEYNRISELGSSNGGIRLYRNGFRVLPYGEIGNDWVNIDKTSVKTQDNAYVPFNNPNFFGFVELIDPEGKTFEETSSREGLIENEAFNQLTDFVNKALRIAAQRINSGRFREKTNHRERQSEENHQSTNDNRSTREKLEDLKGGDQDTNAILEEAIQKLEEAEMLRVLAGIGLSIGEFTHEIRQFIPSFNGSINFLLAQNLSASTNESLINLQENFNRFKTYTSFIDHTIAENASRDKRIIELSESIRSFKEIIVREIQTGEIIFDEDYFGYDLYTCPMHPSEWTSILYNLYTNSKKAIKRAQREQGKIMIIGGRDEERVYLEFMDNGDGIPDNIRDRIFDAFFTTSTPPSSNATKDEIATGTGLGLKIVRDIVRSYGGDIFVTSSEEGYTTNFRIEIPEATPEQIKNYDY